MKLFRRGKAAAKAEPTPVGQDSLSILCQGDEGLHYAMSYFLYLKPEEQIALIGGDRAAGSECNGSYREGRQDNCGG